MLGRGVDGEVGLGRSIRNAESRTKHYTLPPVVLEHSAILLITPARTLILALNLVMSSILPLRIPRRSSPCCRRRKTIPI